jgi:hypothetical protein
MKTYHLTSMTYNQSYRSANKLSYAKKLKQYQLAIEYLTDFIRFLKERALMIIVDLPGKSKL